MKSSLFIRAARRRFYLLALLHEPGMCRVSVTATKWIVWQEYNIIQTETLTEKYNRRRNRMISTFRRRSARVVSGLVLTNAMLAGSAGAMAQDKSTDNFPSRPIRMIIPMAPGGSNDIVGRFAAQKLSERIGQNVVVDNRAGASGIIGSDMAAKARPDGYTIVLVSTSFTQSPSTHKDIPYDPIKSFSPLAMIGSGPNVLVVGPALPVTSVRELIDRAKAKPGYLRYASTTAGGLHHFAGELFKSMAGVDIIHVPYKGGGPAMIDVMAGQVEMTIVTVISGLPHIRSGRLKPLGVTSLKRTPVLPDVPTISESGVPGYESDVWWGLVGPARMPVAIVTKLNSEMGAILRDPDTVKQLAVQGAEPVIISPSEFGTKIASELAKWSKVAKQSGITSL